jgi:peptidoglycan hydrolase-like protein with peptidoglycan-binding domain
VIRTDITNTVQASGSLGYGAVSPVVGARAGAAFTALPSLGQTVVRGQQLYAVDGRPTTLFYGVVPAYRDLVQGMAGADVSELKQNLVALGFAAANGLSSDDTFDASTADAVRRWQASRGLGALRLVQLGDVAYAPGSVRVADVPVSLGQPGQSGAVVLSVTGTAPVVEAPLPVAQQSLVKAGNEVTVTMPDGKTTVPGVVASVSSVATASTQNSNNGRPDQQSGPTVLMTVRLTNAQPGQHFDQAPVNVNVVNAKAVGVLAVPINALQALAGGGYAVAVVDVQGRRLVGVQTGLFSDTQVQVTGAGIAEGDKVEVPAA